MAQKNDLFQDLEVWDRYMPIPYDVAIDLLKRDMPDDVNVTISLNENGDGLLEIQNPSQDVFDDRTFSVKKRTVDSGIMIFNRAARGHGIGRNLMRNEIEFFSMCGIKKYDIEAASGMGGYVWARFGFLPRDYSFMKTVEERYEKLAPYLTDKDKKEVLNAIKNRDVWQLSDLRQEVSPILSDMFNGKSSPLPFSTMVVDAAMVDKPMTLGKALLIGTSWKGSLDFDNEKQIKRADDYVGGIKFTR